MSSFCEKIAIGSQFLLILLGISIISMSLGGLFYVSFSEDIDIIHGNPINMFKLIPVGILILIVILLLWFGISYIVGAIYIKLKKCNFLKEKK